jgi:hypothetical protein
MSAPPRSDPKCALLPGTTGHALLLNHTGLDYHFGCFATAGALYNLLLDDGYSVATQPVDLTHQLDLPTDDPAHFDGAKAAQAIERVCPTLAYELSVADMVVVNGEGTLHGLRKGPRNLLFLMDVAARHFAKPVFLVNHSLFPADKQPVPSPEQMSLYAPVLARLRGIAVRDALSRAIYADMGLACRQSFDLLPLYCQRTGLLDQPPRPEPDLIVIGAGVNLDQAILADLADTVIALAPPGARLVFLDGAPRRDPVEEQAFLAMILARGLPIRPAGLGPTPGVSDGMRAARWLETIARARLVVTGRYHHVMAALTFGTPVVALSSNTPKIEGSYRLLGIDQPVIEAASPDWVQEFQRALAAALAGDAALTSPEQRARLLRLAQANAVWR